MRINNEEGLFQLFLATNEHSDRYERRQFRQTHNTSESTPAESTPGEQTLSTVNKIPALENSVFISFQPPILK